MLKIGQKTNEVILCFGFQNVEEKMTNSANQIPFEWEDYNFEEETSAFIGGDPKLRVTDGYSLIFEQISRMLGAIQERQDQSRILKDELIHDTGLSDRQIENLSSVAVGIGLIKKRTYNLRPLGIIISESDRFFEKTGTLWVCHYRLGSNPRNIVWHRFFNEAFHDIDIFNTDKVLNLFEDLRDEYSENSFQNHLPGEISTLLSAYEKESFNKLRMIDTLDTNKYKKRIKHAPVEGEILLFTIYDFRNRFLTGDTAVEIPTLIEEENSPGRVLDLQGGKLRDSLNQLHNEGHISMERQYDLDQIILSEDYSALKVLQRYYAEQS